MAKNPQTSDRSGLKLRKTIPFNFSPEHRAYIRRCQDCTFNILEGAVRSGKTVDNVFAFAHELMTTPDRLHLATGSTAANAKLNIGDANGFGLEWIFRGQCRWTKYKGNEALYICGPYTRGRPRIVIFAGGSKADSYKKIRGNSYGMWIATEINLHHDNTIKEAFNRQLAAKRRKIFWDLNPCHPKDPIYENYIDLYKEKAEKGELLGGYNYQLFNIFQNPNISEVRLREIISQYDEGSIWYIRDILGRRSIAEGLIYSKLATAIAARNHAYTMKKKDAQALVAGNGILGINVGVDFGGNGSGHAFVASAVTSGYEELVLLRSERYVDGKPDPYSGARLNDIDPQMLGQLFVRFLKKIMQDYGYISRVYADSAEQVLIRGFRTILKDNGLGGIKVMDAMKMHINDRIFATTSLVAQERFFYVEEDCHSFEDAVSMAVWDPKKLDLERLDDGTSDIDTMDAFEYSFERDINRLIKKPAGR